MSVNQMTETTCPTCGAKCSVLKTRCTCNTPTCVHTECMYRVIPQPQPDLTKLREMYKEHINLVEALANNAREGKVINTEEVLDSMADVIQALEEVLDAETSKGDK